MRFKALLAAMACACSVQVAQAQVLVDGQVSNINVGAGKLNKAKNKLIIYYDFSEHSDSLPSYTEWTFRIGGDAEEGPIDSFQNYWLVDPAKPQTVKGQITAPMGLYPEAMGRYDWRLTTTHPANFKIGIFSVGAVPEPSTWAILILGFGLVGYGMRRKAGALRLSA